MATEDQRLPLLVLQYLESKSFFGAERALRAEIALAQHSDDKGDGVAAFKAQNLYTSELEEMLGMSSVASHASPAPPIDDLTPPPPPPNVTPTDGIESTHTPCSVVQKPPKIRPNLVGMSLVTSAHDDRTLRTHYGRGTPQTRVVFHDPPSMNDSEAFKVAHVSLPVLYNPNVNGLEDARELLVAVGTILVGRYRVVAVIGKGSFSRVFQCLDLRLKVMVSVKVLRNDKDCLDAGLGEVKILALLAKHNQNGERPLVRLRDYFYYKEHLLIVTELLRDSLFQFYKYIDATSERGLTAYFTPPTIAAIAYQMLQGLELIHNVGLVHCDIKPENVCLVSASRKLIKIIDFGSCVCGHDTRNSYVQSRWYRAPEVMLGIRWDTKVDMWSLGCLLAELLLGYPLFHGGTVAAVLAAQQAVLGAHPPMLHERCPKDTHRMYFTPRNQLYTVDPPGKPPGVYAIVSTPMPLEKLLPSEDAPMLSFISSLLRYDPNERPTAATALQHPFITAHVLRQRVTEDKKTSSSSTLTSLLTPEPVPSPNEAKSGLANPGDSAWGWQARAREKAKSEGEGQDPPSPHPPKAGPLGQPQLFTAKRGSSFESGVLGGYESNASSFCGNSSSVEGSPSRGSPRSSPKNSPSPRRPSPSTTAGPRPPKDPGNSHLGSRGPGVPEEFRNAVRSNESRDGRAHDWKARIARFVGQSGAAASRTAPSVTAPASARGESDGWEGRGEQASWMQGEGPAPWSGELVQGHGGSGIGTDDAMSFTSWSDSTVDFRGSARGGGGSSRNSRNSRDGDASADDSGSDVELQQFKRDESKADQGFVNIPGSPATVPPRGVAPLRRKKMAAGKLPAAPLVTEKPGGAGKS